MASESQLSSSFAFNTTCPEKNYVQNGVSSQDCGNSKRLNGPEPVNGDDGMQSRPSCAELASRKAEEAASRRYQAAAWLREMVGGATDLLPNEPTEEEFRLGLHNGLILCNVLNKVIPGAVTKVVEIPGPVVPFPDGAALSAIQYFENVRNFLVAVEEMQLPTFEASDLEQGGSSTKVVDCVLALKLYYDWKHTGGQGLVKYGVNVKFPDGIKLPIRGSGKSSDSVNNSPVKNNQDQVKQSDLLGNIDISALLEYLCMKFPEALSAEYTNKDFSLNCNGTHPSSQVLSKLLLAILSDKKAEEVPMLVESMLRKVNEEFERRLANQGEQLRMVLKDLLKCEDGSFLDTETLGALTKTSNLTRDKCQANEGKQGNHRISKLLYAKQFPLLPNMVDGHRSLDPKKQLQQKEIEELKYTLHITREGVQMLQLELKEELENLEIHFQGLAKAAAGYNKVLEENRQLYNQVQDLKGSIRVYCRVRPFLPGQDDRQSTVDFIGENGTLMIVNPNKQGKDARKTFAFNKVFASSATQEEVFLDTQPLIRSVLDGYNVCIFAYGQTGSGKTYTMTGPHVITEETWGVNYRALNDLFEISKKRTDVFMYQVGVQMIEIYNEQVRDLLATDGSNRRLEIRNNSQQNGLNVPDANLVSVTSTFDVINLMNIGQKNRVVGATALNDRSSRSHSVLTVHVQGTDLTTGSILRGCLHLVDLAGSERVDKSEATGDRLKEAQHINKSLSALGDVIAALAQKSSHVPYRNSKLTQLLQDSLGGQAKALMFAHISPETDAYNESLSTLKFAERVATVELGAARSNKESGEIRELKEQIYNLKVALAKKEAEVEQFQSNRSTEKQRMKVGVSPLHSHRQSRDLQALSNRRQPMEEVGNIEVRSCSTGRQRKPIYGRDVLGEAADANSPRPIRRSSPERRSLSVERRSVSADRGNHTRSRVKHDPLEEQEVRKWQDKVTVNKYLTIHTPTSQDDALRPLEACELAKQDSISDMFYQRCQANPRKIYPEREDRQFLMDHNEGYGGVKRNKLDVKGKNEYQVRRNPHHETSITDESDIDLFRTSDFSEADLLQFKELNLIEVPPIQHVPRIRKTLQSSTRTPHHMERRSPIQAKSPSSASRLESKLYGGGGQPKPRTVRQSVSNLPYAGTDGKRTSPGGKFKP